MALANLTADKIDALEPQRQSGGMLRINGLIAGDALELAVQAFPLPKRGIGVIEIRHLNEVRKFAGNPTFDDLQVTFNDYIEKDLAGILDKWFQQVHNNTNGKTGFARSYKKTGTATTFGPNGQYERDWELRGVWPSNMDPGDIDHTAEDAVRIQMTLTIDKALRGAVRPGSSITSD